MDSNEEGMFVSKFVINEQILYSKISCNPNEEDLLKIEIFSYDQSWSGHFSRESAKTFGDRLDESEEEYFKNVIIALKGIEGTYVLDFTPEKEKDLSKFVWKRIIPKEYSKHGFVEHGHVMLKKNIPVITKNTIIDYLMFQNETLQCTIEDYKDNYEALNIELVKCKKELENLVVIKNLIETNLYGKFVQVLNSKKKRIKLLESQLDNNEKNGQCIDDENEED
ncbi:unnamed protein product, partial [Brenthis ino]